MRYLRYTTYRGDEELTATINRIDPLRRTGVTASALRQDSNGGRSGLLKSHECAVLFPDGSTGTCRYTRGGPAWHIFRFSHPGRDAGSIRPMTRQELPAQHFTSRMENSPTAIALKAQEMASGAYDTAIRRERQEHFCRVMPPVGSKPDPFKAQFSVKRAKEIAGRYTICVKLGENLLPTVGFLLDTLDEANAIWRENGGGEDVVLACACRWSRRWEMPRFNPLYGNKQSHGELQCSEEEASDDETDEE